MEYKYKDIDYSKLNERIVEQAWHSVPSILDEEDVKKMIAEKLERARQEREGLVKSGLFAED